MFYRVVLPILLGMVGALTLPTVRAIWRVLKVIAERVRTDHQTITQCQFRNDQGGRSRLYMNMAVAPARRLRRWHKLERKALSDWVSQEFGEYGLKLSQVARPRISFEADRDPSISDRALLYISESGLLETCLPIQQTKNGEVARVGLLEIAKVVYCFVAAVGKLDYRRTFGIRGLPLRFDWFIGITRATNDGNWQPWSEISFPGREPDPKPSQQLPILDGWGLGETELRGSRPKRAVVDITSICLRDLIESAGYGDPTFAVSDTLKLIGEGNIGASRLSQSS